MTNWFDPKTKPVRLMLFGIMLVGLVMAAAIPSAFENGGLVFAVSYAIIQIGRTLFVLANLGRHHELTPNFQRILGWVSLSSAFWIAGAMVQGNGRFVLWAAGVLSEFVSPMVGFWMPVLGRSSTKEWTIEGGHLAERCQLIMIIALGECVLVTGSTLSTTPHFDAEMILAFLSAFLGSLAMWWIYFDTSSKDGTEAIVHSSDPGRIGAYFHYTHATMVAGIIAGAVASELIIAHPHNGVDAAAAIVFAATTVLYLLGNALYKKVVYGSFPASHILGLLASAALFAMSIMLKLSLLAAGTMGTVLLVVVATWDTFASRCRRRQT